MPVWGVRLTTPGKAPVAILQTAPNSRSFGLSEFLLTLKNKTVAGVLALFAGWAGLHRFYLGQPGLGVVYFSLFFFRGFSILLGLADAMSFFFMRQEKFDSKYNPENSQYSPGEYAKGGYPPPVRRPQKQHGGLFRNMRFSAPTPGTISNPHKASGIRKYKDFDLDEAIADFKAGLVIEPDDIALHFNLACAYSLTEKAELAYQHLDRAVAHGFSDVSKILTHDDLAFVRIQDRWEAFRKNSFRLREAQTHTVVSDTPPPIPRTAVEGDNLLSQLNRLAELRHKGLISEQEFMMERRKLTR